MRGAMLLALLLGTAACQRERSFDERYNDTARQIEQRAGRLDAEIDAGTDAQPVQTVQDRRSAPPR